MIKLIEKYIQYGQKFKVGDLVKVACYGNEAYGKIITYYDSPKSEQESWMTLRFPQIGTWKVGAKSKDGDFFWHSQAGAEADISYLEYSLKKLNKEIDRMKNYNCKFGVAYAMI